MLTVTSRVNHDSAELIDPSEFIKAKDEKKSSHHTSKDSSSNPFNEKLHDKPNGE